MKRLSVFVIAAFLTSGSLFANSSEIKLGHSRENLTHLLGEPIGALELGNKTLLMYPQGDVTLKGDKVSEINLMSDAEFTAQEEHKQLEREEWRIQQEKLSVMRKKEGEQIKAAKLQSSAFIVLPAKQRVDYWRSFQVRYPEVDVTEQITRELEIYKIELAEKATERRIAALEARVLQAEKALKATQAEKEWLQSQLDNQNHFGVSRYEYSSRFYPTYYPRNQVIIRSGGNRSVYRNQSCPDTNRYTGKDPSHRTDESTAERARRILSSAREQSSDSEGY